MWLRAVVAVGLVSTAWAQADLANVLTRLAEEAEVFRQNAPKSLSRETLEQRAVLAPSRFKPRAGQAALEAPALRLQVRKIVSEYSVAPLKGSDSPNLYEFRQVVSVDDRPVQSDESARHALSLGVKSADDRLRKRMLEDFAKNGLVDIATDYGLILLAFSKRELEHTEIRALGTSYVGADPALELSWQQTSDTAGVLEFQGKQVRRRAMAGRLWVRASDGLLLRVESWFEHPGGKKEMVRDEATVDYARSSHGFLVPASVHHRHLVDGKLLTENLYAYETFRLFAADAEIKFTEVPDLPPSDTTPPVK
jgi:hypothetical protein